LINVVESILSNLGATYIWYVVNENKLRKYATQKADVDKKNFKRPSEEMID
jgi:hypothetical protein